jgi:hypothetical protein
VGLMFVYQISPYDNVNQCMPLSYISTWCSRIEGVRKLGKGSDMAQIALHPLRKL